MTAAAAAPMVRAARRQDRLARREPGMKIVNSLKSAKKRDRYCRIVRRRGRTYVINKRNKRFKARQG